MRAALILGSFMALGACSVGDGHEAFAAGSGEMGERSYAVGQFDGISLAGSQKVIVTVGGAQSVRAEGEARALDRLEIEVTDGKLRIGQKENGDRKPASGRNHPSATIYVTTPSLAAAELGGSGKIDIDRVEGDDFAASIGGSGDLRVASLRVGNASFSIAGSGDIIAAGTAETANMSVVGSGDADLSGLRTENISIAIIGSGDVRAHASGTASISTMGSGDAHVTGPARCTVNKSGSGDVRCGA